VEVDTGVVTRPGATAPPANVTLTAMVSLDGGNATRDFAATAGTPTGDRIATAGETIAYGNGVREG
jgi:hypothetical protein